MIPVDPQPEPTDFTRRVRKPGRKFLAGVSQPKSKDWKNKDYWQKVLPDMRVAYKGICAYCARWIPHSTGRHSIDHFIPKSVEPSLAYEWSNFRYVSARFNSRKGTRSIIDPFQLNEGWFTLDFSTFLIKPNPTLTTDQQKSIQDTIEVLQLNRDEDLVTERQTWVEEFWAGEISFEHLEKKTPFIAYELERQNMIK